jgi:predicted enzyme related to lactoylglutathione lyase
MPNQIVWVDIPVLELDRAITFYSAMLGVPVKKEEFDGMSMGLLPHEGNDVGGSLATGEGTKPSVDGPLIYLNVHGRLDEAIAAVEPSGGKILQPKHQIGPYGFRAVVIDSEGNRVALHSK